MKILLADDHELVRDTIAGFIRSRTGHEVTGASDLPEALAAVKAHGPYDLVLLDYQMPGMFGLRGLTQMVAQQAGRPVAILSGSMPFALIEHVFQSGGHGFLPKTMATQSMLAAIDMLLAGEKYAPSQVIMNAGQAQGATVLPNLTQREIVVLRHVCQGMTNQEIARELGVHETTIKVHVKSICGKIDARNRTQATMIAKEAGFC